MTIEHFLIGFLLFCVLGLCWLIHEMRLAPLDPEEEDRHTLACRAACNGMSTKLLEKIALRGWRSCFHEIVTETERDAITQPGAPIYY